MSRKNTKIRVPIPDMSKYDEQCMGRVAQPLHLEEQTLQPPALPKQMVKANSASAASPKRKRLRIAVKTPTTSDM